MNICDSLYQINDSIIREVQLSMYNGNFPCPLWSWVPNAFFNSKEPSVTKFSFELAQIAFQGQYTQSNKHTGLFCRKYIFKLAKTDQHDYVIICYVFNVKHLTNSDKERYMQRNYLTPESVSKFSSTTFQLEQIESMSKAPDLVQVPKISQFLSSLNNETIYMAATCVIDLKQLESFNSVHNTLLHLIQSHLNDIALLIQGYIIRINVSELRQIVTGKLEQMNKSIKQAMSQVQYHTSQHQNAFCKCHLYNQLTEEIFRRTKIHNLAWLQAQSNEQGFKKREQLQKMKFIQCLKEHLQSKKDEKQINQVQYKSNQGLSNIQQCPQKESSQFEQTDNSCQDNKLNENLFNLTQDIESDSDETQPIWSLVSQNNETITLECKENETSKSYDIPKTIWNKDLFTKHVSVLKNIALKQTYLAQRSLQDDSKLDQSRDTLDKDKINIRYIRKVFRESQVEQALKNLMDEKVIREIQQQLLMSGYKMVIVGPPVLADLLTMSLSILIPPDARDKIIYSDMNQDICSGACDCTINTEYIIEELMQPSVKSASHRMSMSSGQNTFLNTKTNNNSFITQNIPDQGYYPSHISGLSTVTSNKETQLHSKNISVLSYSESSHLAYELSNALIPRYTCQRCGNYYHGIHFVAGASIQSISGTKQSIKLLNLIMQTDKSPAFVFLTETDPLRPSLSPGIVGPQYSWKNIKEKVQRAVLRKKAQDIVFIMQNYQMLIKENQNVIEKVQKNIQAQTLIHQFSDCSLQTHTVLLSFVQLIGEICSGFQLQQSLNTQAKNKNDINTSYNFYDNILTHIRINQETINNQILELKYKQGVQNKSRIQDILNSKEQDIIEYDPRYVKLFMNNVYNTNNLLQEDVLLNLYTVSTANISIDILPNGAIQYIKSQQQFLKQLLAQENSFQSFKKLPTTIRSHLQDLAHIITMLITYYFQNP